MSRYIAELQKNGARKSEVSAFGAQSNVNTEVRCSAVEK
jgi:hypothetical protein